ncbi:MAG TPA: hypothetical protein VE978_23745 [Chitinophagales bacterium]|nr:hypothetical protein [Chitinophagales bacterium]
MRALSIIILPALFLLSCKNDSPHELLNVGDCNEVYKEYGKFDSTKYERLDISKTDFCLGNSDAIKDSGLIYPDYTYRYTSICTILDMEQRGVHLVPVDSFYKNKSFSYKQGYQFTCEMLLKRKFGNLYFDELSKTCSDCPECIDPGRFNGELNKIALKVEREQYHWLVTIDSAKWMWKNYSRNLLCTFREDTFKFEDLYKGKEFYTLDEKEKLIYTSVIFHLETFNHPNFHKEKDYSTCSLVLLNY